MTRNGIRSLRFASWAALLLTCLYLYFFRADLVQSGIQSAFSQSLVLGYLVYLVLGCLRGFTLIPSTHLILLGIPFFPPVPLFILSLIGIVFSSASIYYFSGSLHLDELFEMKNKDRIEKMKAILQRNQMPIIIGWSFFPLAPTDLICYVCGVLKVDFFRFVAGVLIGEGTICGIYIFLGDTILRFLHLR